MCLQAGRSKDRAVDGSRRTARVVRAAAASAEYSRVLAASMYQSANWLQKKSYTARPASPKSSRCCAAVTRSTTCAPAPALARGVTQPRAALREACGASAPCAAAWRGSRALLELL